VGTFLSNLRWIIHTKRLKRRFPDTQSLEREAEAWCEERNRLGTSVEWRFTTEDARIKLRKLYPSIDT
jgi:hypothetical protein